jgi:hypothetical protein
MNAGISERADRDVARAQTPRPFDSGHRRAIGPTRFSY